MIFLKVDLLMLVGIAVTCFFVGLIMAAGLSAQFAVQEQVLEKLLKKYLKQREGEDESK